MIWPLLLGLACHPEKPEKVDTGSIIPPPTACGPQSEEQGPTALGFSSTPPRNLLFISVDTLRRDRVGRYDTLASTPFLDGLMADSVVLDDMRSCANWTLPGMTCLMTGQSTLDMGLEPLVPGPNTGVGLIPDNLETLATWLGAAGWQSSLITAAYLFSDAYPITNGFQQVLTEDDAPASWMVGSAIDQLHAFKPDQSWYLHLHFRDPHITYNPPWAYQGDLAGQDIGPYDPRLDNGVFRILADIPDIPPEMLEELRSDIDTLYRGEVSYLDAELSRLWQALEAAGSLDDTLVVITADHGEQNFEHLGFQHAQSLHAEEAMIMGIFWARSLDSMAFANPVSQPDIAPTILDALGVGIPSSVTGHVIGTDPADRVRLSSAVTDEDHPTQAVDRNGFRLIYDWTGERHFFRYDEDPAEEFDLYDSANDDVRCLWDFLRPAMAMEDAKRAGITPVHPE